MLSPASLAGTRRALYTGRRRSGRPTLGVRSASTLEPWSVAGRRLDGVVDVGASLLDDLREKPAADDKAVPHRELGDRTHLERLLLLGRAPPVPLAPDHVSVLHRRRDLGAQVGDPGEDRAPVRLHLR